MRRAARWIVIGVVVLGVSTPQAPSAQGAVDTLFEAYQAGRYDAVWAQLSTTEDWGDLRDAIAAREGVWPAEARAAFTLEAAIVAQQTAERVPNAYQDEAGLFKDACRMVRDLAPGSIFEARWHGVALSLLAVPSTAGIDFGDHLGHIRDRLDPGRWALAAVRPREESAWRFLFEIQPGTNDLDDRRVRRERVNIRFVLDHLEEAEGIEAIRAEAMLRRGALLAQWGEHERAVEVLEPVPGLTDDGRLQHLAFFHLGRAYLAAGDHERARPALEAAVRTQPAARSGLLLLASLEFAENHRAEADRVTRRALAADAERDPWLTFFAQEARLLPERLAALRELAR